MISTVIAGLVMPMAAAVYCSFATIDDPGAGFSDIDFWSVYLQRQTSGRWLIKDWGQP